MTNEEPRGPAAETGLPAANGVSPPSGASLSPERPVAGRTEPDGGHGGPSRPAEWRWPSIHREGWRFVGGAAAVAAMSALLGWSGLAWAALAATVAIAAFFRDPERVTPDGDDLLVAPADGLVSQIAEVEVPRQLVGPDGLAAGRCTRISIFLSVFDVHVNRAPLAGTVRRIVYVPGLFLNANLDKASEDNERSLMVIEGFDGTRVGVVQIAGLVARRIVTFVHEGAMLAAGQRYGLIRFGSRTDLYVPAGWAVTVRKGQRAVGGETVLARREARRG